MSKKNQEAFVKNAADEKQVKKAESKENIKRTKELNDIRDVMSTDSGRRLMWRILEKCQTFGSVNRASGSQTYYCAGQQDVGHFLMGELASADELILGKLLMENYKGEINV